MELSEALKLPAFKRLNWVKNGRKRLTQKGIKCVYIFVGAGKIRYIGSTICLRHRMYGNSHFNSGYCLFFAVVRNRLEVEKRLLKIATPLHNINVGYNKKKQLIKAQREITPIGIKYCSL